MADVLLQDQPAADASRNVRSVVVPVGGTDREFLAQEQAVELAAALGVGIRAVHVSQALERASNERFRFLEQCCARWDVPLESRTIEGVDVADELIQELGPLDLAVIGTRRLGGRYHLNSVTERLIKGAPCAVQVVRLGQ